ncbi:MAG: heavy-metal-associated domain-containing protein [Dehalococcoidia bacterium]
MRGALAGLHGVAKASVDLERGVATLEADPTTPAEAMERAVHGRVILWWARSLLARLPFLGKGAL